MKNKIYIKDIDVGDILIFKSTGIDDLEITICSNKDENLCYFLTIKEGYNSKVKNNVSIWCNTYKTIANYYTNNDFIHCKLLKVKR